MPESIKCFLIDDDVDDQEIFSIALERLDINVQCEYATGGKEAIEKMLDNPSYLPNYIFIDINMPRMNGRECLEAIKKIDRLSGIPVFMYSTSEDPQIISETRGLGARDFLVKPPTIKDLSGILAKIFFGS